MTNKSNNSKNFFDTMIESQTQTVDTMLGQAKKFSNGNPILNDTIEKGAELYKKGLHTAKENITKLTDETTKMQENLMNQNDNMKSFFNNWKEQQSVWSNQMKDMNNQFMQYWMNPTNTQNYFQQAQQNMGNLFNVNPMQQFSGMNMEWMNPTQWQTQFTQANDQVTQFWNQFQTLMNTNYNHMKTQFENGTIQDSWKGMTNMTEGFTKFYELWMPMLKSINEKNFNMEQFKSMLNMNSYKEFMDKYFSFIPQGNQDYMNQWKNFATDAYKQQTAMNQNMMNSMKGNFNNMFPFMAHPFANMLNGYNQMYSQMMSAVTPFAKLMAPNNDMKSMQAWSEIFNNMNIYNIKNSELQFMVYETGMKVMEGIAEKVMHKIENGEEVTSMMKLYQEWLNLSDSQYVTLFETDEYSKLLAEVSSLQMRIRKDIETQMEKAFVNIPVATRSEMDEVYHSLYELKKEVRNMGNKTTPAPKAAASESAAPKATRAPKAAVKKAAPAPAKKGAKRK
jgi:hypothetical protein